MNQGPQDTTLAAEARATFSEKSSQYAAARPQYPAELFAWLAQTCAAHGAAWDCAAGNGQAAVGLSPYFDTILATDISQAQIDHGMARDNVIYSVGAAEHSGFPDHRFDLVVVAQALHWFDYSKFWPEVARVAKEGALFCAWGYDWPETRTDIHDGLVAPLRALIAPFWASNNKLLWDGYRPADVDFPFPPLATPALAIRLEWTIGDLVEYMATWSAFKRGMADPDTAARITALLARSQSLAPPEEPLAIAMPLKMLAGRIGRLPREA